MHNAGGLFAWLRVRHDGFDPKQQGTRRYAGRGEDINFLDPWAVRGQGAIHDLMREHLACSDKAIAAKGQLLPTGAARWAPPALAAP